MLTIRTEQMKAMSDAVAGRFQGQMVAFLGQAFPQQTAGKSDAQLLATVLELCDGERDLTGIVAVLAERYTAPPAVIEKDVVAMLADLRNKRVLET